MVKFTFAFKSFNSPTFCNNSKINLKKNRQQALGCVFPFLFTFPFNDFLYGLPQLDNYRYCDVMVDVQKKSLLFDIHLHNRFDENTSKSAETHI